MEHLQHYYDEHAQQARQHEDQRERVTNIILSIAGVLVGLITFSEFSLGAIAASLTLVVLGIFGFFFSGKHYERFKFHTAIMSQIRHEIDHLKKNPASTPASLSQLRRNGEQDHYTTFDWPSFRRSNSGAQGSAKSWIAKQRVHVFWEAVPLLVAVMGFALTTAIVIRASTVTEPKPIRVEVVKSTPN